MKIIHDMLIITGVVTWFFIALGTGLSLATWVVNRNIKNTHHDV